jgi:hypothetical protein
MDIEQRVGPSGVRQHAPRFTLREAALLGGLILAATSPALAQTPSPVDSRRPFEISDNSFLVEEALNQEPGVFQNIVGLGLDSRDEWVATFSQEWPLVSRRHQIAYSVPYASIDRRSGIGDALIHYRLQATSGDGAWPAFSPRVSLIVPSGRASEGLGRGNPGWEVNLPFSKQVRDVYFHWNAGFTHFPAVESDGAQHGLMSQRVAASGIWRARPMINLMLEGVAERYDESTGLVSRHANRYTVVPGVRTGWNIGHAQTIVGIGLPIVFADGSHHTGAFVYFSHELPFARTP